MVTIRERSLYLPELDLWLDSMTRRRRSYVSHGHADHARPHDLIVCTPASAEICMTRFHSRKAHRYETHNFYEPWHDGRFTLTLYPAGHVLGSSQLLVESNYGRFVYTGDFTLAPSLTTEPTDVPRCDTVLMECTFGRPKYVFPARDEIAADMTAFARDMLERQRTPVFYAYSLGKAQEAMAILGRAGIPLAVHPAVAEIAAVYEACGIALPPYTAVAPDETTGPCALIWPPSAKSLPQVIGHRGTAHASLTGWALDEGRPRHWSRRAFALSAHADFPGLLAYLERAAPKNVILNHGPKSFVKELRKRGWNAEYLELNSQLSLL